MTMTWRVSCPTLVGRAEQLAGLRSAIAAASRRRISLMLVGGAAGMGKTRLIGEAADWAATIGHAVIEGACLPLGEGLPYGPFAEMLGPDLFIGRSGDDRLTLFRAAADTLSGHAYGDSLVVVLEDLHWADASTCDLLVFCARMLASRPILIIGSHRTDHAVANTPFGTVLANLGSASWLRQLELSPLTRPETAEQIAGIRGSEPPADLVDRVHARCGGNPFYAEELLAADPIARRLPRTLRAAVLSRLDQLGGEARTVARVLAVSGVRTHRQLLLAACRLDPAGIDAGVAALTAGGLVTQAGPGYEFRHALAREAVLTALGPAERTATHREVAELLTEHPELAVATTASGRAAERADHWEAAGEAARAFSETLAAARAAEAVMAPAEALTALERALTLHAQLSGPPAVDGSNGAGHNNGADRIALLERAGSAAIIAGRHGRAIELLSQVLASRRAGADPQPLAATLTRLSIAEGERGRLDRSAALLDEAAGMLVGGPPSAALAAVLARRADLYLTQLRDGDCVQACWQAIGVARAAAAPEAEGIARLALGRAICRAAAGNDDEGVTQMLRGLDLVCQHGDLRTRTLAIYHAALVLRSLSRFDAALAVARDGHEELTRLGVSPDWLIMLQLAQAQALHRLGRLAEAESLLAGVEPSSSGVGVIGQVALAEVLVLRGELARARAIFAGLPDHAPGREPQFRDMICPAYVELLAAERRWDEARRHCLAGLRAAGTDLSGYRGCAAGLRLEADRAEAGFADDRTPATVQEVLAALPVLSARDQLHRPPRPEAACYTALARADAGRALGRDDPRLWQRAVGAADATAEPWPQAYARYRLGVALLTAGGSRREGAGLLTAARQIAAGMGAGLLEGEITAAADRFRVSADTRPQPADPLARYRLTPRETEVLALVASGASNGEIASTLFIGAKTASAHVTHILRKLGVPTRTRAAAIAYRGGLGAAPPTRT
jgi:DNA-binding CsgD family transcriptional regulator/tetratricopeptide (TPR) repeat protein